MCASIDVELGVIAFFTIFFFFGVLKLGHTTPRAKCGDTFSAGKIT